MINILITLAMNPLNMFIIMQCLFTPLVPKAEYSVITWPIAWLLMPWLLASPEHQQLAVQMT